MWIFHVKTAAAKCTQTQLKYFYDALKSDSSKITLWYYLLYGSAHRERQDFTYLSYERQREIDFITCFAKCFSPLIKLTSQPHFNPYKYLNKHFQSPTPLLFCSVAQTDDSCVPYISGSLPTSCCEIGPLKRGTAGDEGRKRGEARIFSPALCQGMCSAVVPLTNFSSCCGHLLSLYNITFFLDLCSLGGEITFLISVSSPTTVHSLYYISPLKYLAWAPFSHLALKIYIHKHRYVYILILV